MNFKTIQISFTKRVNLDKKNLIQLFGSKMDMD